MVVHNELEHPFSAVDMPRLDSEFSSLLARTESPGHGTSGEPGKGLSGRERRLFRFGVLAGLGEWDLADDAMMSLVDDGLLDGAEVERAAAEAGLIRGWPACAQLSRRLAARGLRGPSTVAEALRLSRTAPRTTSAEASAGRTGLTEREASALGLGITWGARCWDT